MNDKAPKFHWHVLLFIGNPGGDAVYISRYLGLSSKNVSAAVVNQFKKQENVPNNFILMSCCHMGYMSEYDFYNEVIDDN